MTTRPAPWIKRVFRLPGTSARALSDLDAEFAFHFQERVEELMAQGMGNDDAEREVRRRFGDVSDYRRQAHAIDERILRQHTRVDRTETLARELRHAMRALRRSPSFSVVAVLTLALGIGATTAIFTVLDRVVLRPLPFANAHRLVNVRSAVSGRTAAGFWGVSVAGYFEYRRHNHTFDDIGAYGWWLPTVTDQNGPERVPGAVATASLVHVLGLRAAAGRLITANDDHPGAPNVAVLGYDLWRRRYGADPTIVGRTITIEGSPFTVVGVMGEGMQLPDQRVDVWLPLPIDSLAPPVNDHSLRAIGLLKEGVSPADAQRDLAALTRRFPELFPDAYSESFLREYHFVPDVVPARDVILGNVGRVLWVLLASVGLVLVIACANVANLQLVRLELRQREVDVRRALGATHWHITWHFLSEALLLSAAAGVTGVGLAWSGIRILLAIAPSSIPRLAEVHLGAAAVVFATALSLGIGILFGAAAGVRYRRANFAGLREGARGATASGGQLAARDVLLVSQVAIALVLLAAAALLLQSFRNLRNVRPGFDPAGALTFNVSLPRSSYGSYAAVEGFYRRLVDRLSALPGVTAVGATQGVPLSTYSNTACALVFVEGRPVAKGETAPCVLKTLVTPTYFAALRIPVRGRVPTWTEVEEGRADLVISASLARRLWPGEDALGKGLSNGSRPPFYRVVGIAGDVHAEGLDQPPTDAVYYPLMPPTGRSLWSPPNEMGVVVRTSSARAEALTGSVRQAIADLDKTVPMANAQSLAAIVAQSMARWSFATLLLGIAGGMALLLSAVGVFGAIAFVVSRRRREIGVRIALGARPASVSAGIVLQTLRLGAIGAVLGIIAALASTRVLRSLLVGVGPSDPMVLVAVTVVLLAVVAAAGFIPARRAARVDPVDALRAE